MSQEVIYTSAPQGLRPGSFGFCTVAATPGMASSLAERLESLSGYRHLFPPGDPQAALNAVVYSHLIVKVGGRRLHILSRIADAGLDYSQRSNREWRVETKAIDGSVSHVASLFLSAETLEWKWESAAALHRRMFDDELPGLALASGSPPSQVFLFSRPSPHQAELRNQRRPAPIGRWTAGTSSAASARPLRGGEGGSGR